MSAWTMETAETMLRVLLPAWSPAGKHIWRRDGHADPARVSAARRMLAHCEDMLGGGYPAPPRLILNRVPKEFRDLAGRYALVAASRMLMAGHLIDTDKAGADE